MVTDENKSTESKYKPHSHLLKTIGMILIVLSGVCFFTMLAVPLFSLSKAQKGMLGGALFIGVQAAWWTGVTLTGPAAIKKISVLFRRSDD